MKVNVSHEAFMRAIESLNDPEHGNPSKSEFLAAHNVKSKDGGVATMFALKFA